MLPDPDHRPPSRSERDVRLAVSLDISLQFGRPVPLVRGRHPAVVRACVPEATIYEDRDSARGEDNVGPDRPTAGDRDREILPEAVPEAVE